MPRSPNRRTIEIPVPLYEELASRAKRNGSTMAAVVQALIVDGIALQEHLGELSAQIAALRSELQSR